MTETQPTATAEQRVKLVLEWLAALESGRYRQGKNRLHLLEDDSYCCLGVACDLFAKRFGVERHPFEDYERFDGIAGVLPVVLCDAIGLSSISGRVAIGDCLSERNDSGETFPQIAAFIRSMPPGLFTPEAEEQLRPRLQPTK
jgi:hypothetical protein